MNRVALSHSHRQLSVMIDDNLSVLTRKIMNFVNRILVHLLRPRTVMHLKALDHYINGEKEIKLLKALVDPKKNAIDAGANIGTYSYFLRKYANKVYAYEPNPELAARLGRLLPDITVRQVALSDKSGNLKFSIPKDASGQP